MQSKIDVSEVNRKYSVIGNLVPLLSFAKENNVSVNSLVDWIISKYRSSLYFDLWKQSNLDNLESITKVIADGRAHACDDVSYVIRENSSEITTDLWYLRENYSVLSVFNLNKNELKDFSGKYIESMILNYGFRSKISYNKSIETIEIFLNE